MRYKRLAAASLAAAVVAGIAAPAAADGPREMRSLPGQLLVVTINAQHNRTLDERRFARLSALSDALRTRPPAFNGGAAGAITAPDVIVVNELTRDNTHILRRLLNLRFNAEYWIAGPAESRAEFLYNTKTLNLGSVSAWFDACRVPDPDPPPPESNRPGSKDDRTYHWGSFTEKATGTSFAVAGLHLKPSYASTGQANCRERNIDLLRLQTETFPGPVIAAGDFNRRAVARALECDPRERSPVLEWYRRLTSPDLGSAYVDFVGSGHADKSEEWTHREHRKKVLCNKKRGYQRKRLDYIFGSNLAVAEAHTDHPGWAGGHPQYSDHRFVWSRLSTVTVPRPARPSVVRSRGGVLDVSWRDKGDVGGYVLYRAAGRNALKKIAEMSAGTFKFRDRDTEHGKRYRYSVAPVGQQGGIGVESRPGKGIADARGPKVIGTTPSRGATSVRRRTKISVRFDEAVGGASAGQIRVYRGGRRVAGTIRKEGPRLFVFKSASRLRAKARYRVVVARQEDRLGNRGRSFSWNFRTGRR